MRKWLLFLVVMFAGFAVFAQDESILWQDNFDDDEDLPLNEVGWFFYCDATIPGNEVKQLDGQLYIKSGNFEDRAAVGIAQTNGVYFIELEDCEKPTNESIEDILADDYSSPNLELTFQAKLKTITSSMFLVGVRAVMDPSQLSADPQQSPAYAILSNPLENKIAVGKYDEPGAAFDPSTWTYFSAPQDFTFELDVYYSYKFYLNEGDIKLKVWKGALEDEPDEWFLEQTDPDPRVTGHSTIFAIMGATTGDEVFVDNVTMRDATKLSGVKESPATPPMAFDLLPNYPNPFNPSTEISYNLDKAGDVRLEIFDQNGKMIKRLVAGFQKAGYHSLSWNGVNEFGLVQASGVYYAKLSADGKSQTIKMTFLK
jgi:hypothetical protein